MKVSTHHPLIKALLLLLIIMNSCVEQRDLYVTSSPLLLVKNDWNYTEVSVSDGATVLLFNQQNRFKEFMPNANSKTFYLPTGAYDVLVFNGLMYSPQETHLDNIIFKNTDNFEEFEAVITPLNPTLVFRKQANETVVAFPDILATRSTVEQEILNRKQFEMKYKDGQNQFPNVANYIADSILFSPCRVTHTCQVVAHVRNPNSARIVQVSLRGFAGSVYLANRMPSHSNVTHQFRLNALELDKFSIDDGTLSSPVFNTFGPPLDLQGRKYELEVNVLLTNNEEYPKMIFDITNQVEKIIEQLIIDRLMNKPISQTFKILIEYDLPPVQSDGVDVGVADWGDDVIITVPIK